MRSYDTTIYVQLLDEGLPCWRPVRALKLPDGAYQIDPALTVPADERWEFAPGDIVTCGDRDFGNGRTSPAAVARIGSPIGIRVDFSDESLLKQVRAFCARWKVSEFSVFGSALRADFTRESDVDVLVTFCADAPWSYWEWPDMIGDLERIFGRRVDLVEQKSLTNPFIRHRVLSTRRVLYAAA